jgi:hypothetical protein
LFFKLIVAVNARKLQKMIKLAEMGRPEPRLIEKGVLLLTGCRFNGQFS